MGNRSSQLDVTHTLSTDTGLCDLNATAVADNAFITDFLVFTTMTLPVLLRSKDALTEQAVALRLQCSIVDGFRLLDLAVRPLADELRRSKADLK